MKNKQLQAMLRERAAMMGVSILTFCRDRGYRVARERAAFARYLRSEGVGRDDIAALLGLSTERVTRIAGLPLDRFEARAPEIRARYAAGERMRDIARSVGCHPQTVSRIVRVKEAA